MILKESPLIFLLLFSSFICIHLANGYGINEEKKTAEFEKLSNTTETTYFDNDYVESSVRGKRRISWRTAGRKTRMQLNVIKKWFVF